VTSPLEPDDDGASQSTVTVVPDLLTARPVGTPGAVGGVTPALAALVEDKPPALVAVTVNEYSVPGVNPVINTDVELVDAVNPPGDDVTTYDNDEPPLLLGADHDTFTRDDDDSVTTL
jgi:hypothetical protein